MTFLNNLTKNTFEQIKKPYSQTLSAYKAQVCEIIVDLCLLHYIFVFIFSDKKLTY